MPQPTHSWTQRIEKFKSQGERFIFKRQQYKYAKDSLIKGIMKRKEMPAKEAKVAKVKEPFESVRKSSFRPDILAHFENVFEMPQQHQERVNNGPNEQAERYHPDWSEKSK